MTEALKLEFAQRDGYLVVVLAGELDRTDTDSARERILTELGRTDRGLVCDLSDLSYIDSAGVHMLHAIGRTANNQSRRVVAVAPRTRTPRRVLEVTRISEEIPVFDTLEEAVESAGSA